MIKFTRFFASLIFVTILMSLSSCFNDDEPNSEKYKEWRIQNEEYVAEATAMVNNDGTPYYMKFVPSWAPQTFVLIHWHNDRAQTIQNLSPMDNSTTQIKYELYNVDGVKLSDSYSNADSTYTSRPSQNIIGMWAALTNMHIGDSVTMVIPSNAAYGEVAHGNIPPYSTLVYNVKLKAITAYEVP